MSDSAIAAVNSLLAKLKQTKPLVHHITNYVTVNDCANITLAIGASPVMADDIEEAAEIASISSALVLNMGTLNQRSIEAMLAAGKKANQSDIPVVFDPVGAGASTLRNRTAAAILSRIKCRVVRGNISEIRCLNGLNSAAKGVDASEEDLSAGVTASTTAARRLAKKLNCVVAVTGATDVISDGQRTLCVENGHPMLGSITGTGCMCSSLTGAFCAVADDPLYAATAGILCMGLAGELAFEKSGQLGVGSYHVALLDAIWNLSAETIAARAKIHEAEH